MIINPLFPRVLFSSLPFLTIVTVLIGSPVCYHPVISSCCFHLLTGVSVILDSPASYFPSPWCPRPHGWVVVSSLSCVLLSRPCCSCMLLVNWVFLPHSAVSLVVFSLSRFFPFPFQSEDAVRRMNSEIIIVNVNSLSPLSSCFHIEHSSLFGSDLTCPCSHAVQKDIFPWN